MDPLASSRVNMARLAVVVIVLAAALAIVAASMLSVSDNASAAGPKTVRGYVFDAIGNPVAGADVTVKMIHLGSTIATETTVAGSDGLYTITFDPFLGWVVGDTIEVTASFSGYQGTNSALADAEPLQYVDVTIGGLTIPEFGALSIAMVCGALVAVFILVGRRRNSL